MLHRPLNRHAPFALWPHFEPGRWIDFNPSFVRLPSGQGYAVIRRDRVPPVPGKGTVWAVAVDERLNPAGQPFPLVADGEDPRAVVVNGRVLVFYVLFEREQDGSTNGRITGTSMVLAEFDPGTLPWKPLAHFKLPKYPLGGAPAGSNPGWEKNWVPFVISPTQVGLIYSHDPWQVIVLNVDASTPERRFEQAYRSDGLKWAWGGIRGSTPPLPCGEGERLTFFHSSEVVGSRKSYLVGACVFEDKPPYRPLRITPEPLLAAPYKGGMHRHGWAVAASVIFPLGCQAVPEGWQLLCGIDDGQIGSFVVPAAELQQRLRPLPLPMPAQVRHPEAGDLPAEAPLLQQPPGAPAPDWPLWRFLRLAAPQGRTLLDVGSDAGVFMAALGAGYRNVEGVASSAQAARWRARNTVAAGMRHANVHLPHDVSAAGLDEAAASVARPPWPLNALDHAGFIDLDLLVCDLGSEGSTPAVLQGLRHTLARDRPLALLLLREEGKDGGSERAAVGEVLAALGYEVAVQFPRSPRALLAVHPSRRDEIAWFV